MKRIFDIRSVSCENVLVGFVILSGGNFSKQIMVLKGLNFPDTLILKSKSKKEKRMKTSNSERILLPLYFVMVGVAVCLNFFSGAKPDMANLVVNISMFIIIGALILWANTQCFMPVNKMIKSMKYAVETMEIDFNKSGAYLWEQYKDETNFFHNKTLNRKFNEYRVERKRLNMLSAYGSTCDLADYINEDYFDAVIKKGILSIIPGVMTGLGILGTFIGLVWGLKSFEPSSYETMTTSVSALVDGIKVAFLTSIYGIAFALIYSSGMKSVYSGMDAKLQGFLERFHLYVLPAAESESRNLMLASQKVQTKAMKQMAEQLTSQMAESFEKAINPTFQKMTESLEILTESVTKCQEDVVQDILRTFLREMNGSFKMQFTDFNEALVQLKEAQKENIDYTTRLYQTMSNQLNTSYAKQSEAMKDLVNELGQVQGRYMSTATRITQDNQEIQKLQQQDYQRIADYLHESEKSSAKFWVACNQTMQKYVEAAAQGMEKVSAANQAGKDVLEANRKLVEQLDVKMKDFVSYQKMTYETMEEVRRLFADISVQKEDNNIYLSGGKSAQSAAQKESVEEVRKLLEEQSERQEALLEEMNKNMKNISKNQKGKFSLFK